MISGPCDRMVESAGRLCDPNRVAFVDKHFVHMECSQIHLLADHSKEELRFFRYIYPQCIAENAPRFLPSSTSQGKVLSPIDRIVEDLNSFLNSDSKVANLSFGVPITICARSAFIHYSMHGKTMIERLHILLDIDNTANDMFTHFINLAFVYDNRVNIMDNIVAVAAEVNQYGQLSIFSNFGTKVMLAAPGEGARFRSQPLRPPP